jgi:hypothetical protein
LNFLQMFSVIRTLLGIQGLNSSVPELRRQFSSVAIGFLLQNFHNFMNLQ